MRFSSAISTLFLLGSLKLATGLPVDNEVAERDVVVVVETVIVTKTAGGPGPQNTGGGQNGQGRDDRDSDGYGGWGWGHHKQQSSVAPQAQPSTQPSAQPQPQPEPQAEPQAQSQSQPQPSAQVEDPKETPAADNNPQPSASSVGGSGGISDDNAKVLELHNEYRRTKCTGLKDLVWDETAANLAKNWVQGCKGLVHSSQETRTVNGL